MLRYNIEDLEEDGFKVKSDPVKPIKKPIAKKPEAKPVAEKPAAQPIAKKPEIKPPQIVYIDNTELVKQLEDSNKLLLNRIEDLVQAINQKPKSFALDIKRDSLGKMSRVIIDTKGK